MFFEKLLGNTQTADFLLNTAFQSFVVLLIGWFLVKISRRSSAPLRSGLSLTTLVILILLPVSSLLFQSQPISLFKTPAQVVQKNPPELLIENGLSIRPERTNPILPTLNQSTSKNKKESDDQKSMVGALLSKNAAVKLINGFGIFWMVGFMFMLLRFSYGLIYVAGFKKGLVRIEDKVSENLIKQIQWIFKNKKLPQVFLSQTINSPVTLGIFHPIIVIPRHLYQQMNKAEIRSILLHEISHIHHRDHIIGIIQRITIALHWWNPLIYSISASFSLAREYVSDNYAIKGNNPLTYAQCLVSLAKKTHLVSSLPVSIGMATPYISLEERIESIISEERVMKTRLKKSGILVLTLGAFLLSILMIKFGWTLASEGAKTTVVTLSEIVNPIAITVDSNQIFISEDDSVSIYSLDDYRLLKKFGREGEGPGEFKFGPYVTPLSDHLFINSSSKISFFSREGEFKNQKIIPFGYAHTEYPMLPVKNNYVGFRYEVLQEHLLNYQKYRDFIFVATLYNQELDQLKSFYRGAPRQLTPPPPPSKKGTPPPKVDYEVIYDYQDLAVYEDKIFIPDTRKGFYIAVFDHQGNLLYEVSKKYKKLKVTDEDKEDYMRVETSSRFATRNQRLNFTFRKHYPAFFSFKIADGKIYVTTYEKKDNKYKMVIMDLEGKVLKKTFAFPLAPWQRTCDWFIPHSSEYDIHNDKIYYLVENEQQKIDLHITDIQ